MINEGGNEGWERFRKRQGKTLKKILNKMRKQEKNKALQFKRFGSKKVAKDAVRAQESVSEGIGAAYMPQAGKKGVPERELTSKAVKKQLNRNKNRGKMKGDLETPHVRYVHSRDKSTDYIRPEKKKRRFKKKSVKENIIAFPMARRGMQLTDKQKAKANAMIKQRARDDIKKRTADKKMQQEGMFDNIKKSVDRGITKVQASPLNPNERKRRLAKVKVRVNDRLKKLDKAYEEYPPGAEADMNRLYKHKTPSAKTMDAMYRDHKKSEQERKNAAKLKKVNMVGQSSPNNEAYDDIKKRLQDKSNRVGDAKVVKKMQKVAFAHRESFGDRGMTLQELGDPSKMNQLFRMGLAKKGELQLMQRMMKRGPDALKDPKLRQKMYDLLVDLTDLVTKDGQTFVKVRQNVQKNKKELQAVKELLHYGGQTILEVNTAYKLINIPEDMSGMSVSSGHKRSVKQGAGMTQKGVAAYRRRNPGSKLKTAVTTKPSKLKPGSKAANRRKAFCARSRSWTGERGKAARRRWNC